MWNNIVIEAFCFGESKDGKYPCGLRYPTAFCLENGHCPHFYYSESSERDATIFVSFRLIVWDRLLTCFEVIRSWLYWYLWGCLWFNKRKTQRIMDSIGSSKAGEFPEIDNMYQEAIDEFPEWIDKARAEWNSHQNV